MSRFYFHRQTGYLFTIICLLTACSKTSPTILQASSCKFSERSSWFTKQLPPELASVSSLHFDSSNRSVVKVIGWQSNRRNQVQEFRGYNITPMRLEIDLARSIISTTNTSISTSIRTPCTGSCVPEVIDESPNKKWQLIQIKSNDKLEAGVWLVNQSISSHLWDEIPGSSSWQWTKQSNRLLYKHSLEGFGIRSLLLTLGENSITESTELKGLANSSFNHVVLNEATGLLASSSFVPTTTQLTFLNSFSGLVQISSTLQLEGIQTPIWSQELNELYVLLQNKGSLTLTSISSNRLFELPSTPSVRGSMVAISPIGDQIVAINNSSKELLLFDCIK